MTLALIDADVAAYPGAFWCEGAASSSDVDEVERLLRVKVPADLRTLWLKYGSLEMFEETILGPKRSATNYVVDGAETYHESLQPRGLFVFMDGIFLSAFDASGNFHIVDQATLEIERTFASLDDWYVELRASFGEAYGLSAMPTP